MLRYAITACAVAGDRLGPAMSSSSRIRIPFPFAAIRDRNLSLVCSPQTSTFINTIFRIEWLVMRRFKTLRESPLMRLIMGRKERETQLHRARRR